jgi:hypothetical protein
MNTFDQLVQKIKILNEEAWEHRVPWPKIQQWLENFANAGAGDSTTQQLHALFLLSKFMYFGSREMRELLRSVFRDLYKYPVVEGLRKRNGDTIDTAFLDTAFQEELEKTRFLGVGNPSESGTHLLYYFRQENALRSELFINAYEVFARAGSITPVQLRDPTITRYVFIDDFCGSGDQALQYSRSIIEDIKRLNPNIQTSYYVLFAMERGLEQVRANTKFDRVEAVFELDDTFKCFGAESRFFKNQPSEITRDFAQAVCRYYGTYLYAGHPLGYRDGQLLLGFFHNTPDNTLPVIWSSGATFAWVPIFRRYPKLYAWGGI